jgi:predicted secreted protein
VMTAEATCLVAKEQARESLVTWIKQTDRANDRDGKHAWDYKAIHEGTYQVGFIYA